MKNEYGGCSKVNFRVILLIKNVFFFIKRLVVNISETFILLIKGIIWDKNVVVISNNRQEWQNYLIFNFCFERYEILNTLSTNSKKWSNTLKQTNCLGVFDHFVGLALEGLNIYIYKKAVSHSQMSSFLLNYFRPILRFCIPRKQ